MSYLHNIAKKGNIPNYSEKQAWGFALASSHPETPLCLSWHHGQWQNQGSNARAVFLPRAAGSSGPGCAFVFVNPIPAT